MLTTLGRRLIAPRAAAQGVRRPNLAPVGLRERAEGKEILGGVGEHGRDLGEPTSKHPGQVVEPGGDVGSSDAS